MSEQYLSEPKRMYERRPKMDIGTVLEQLSMNGVIDRAWEASGGDVEKFKLECMRGLNYNGYTVVIGDVQVIDGKPDIDWPCVYVRENDQRKRNGNCPTCHGTGKIK